MDNEILQIVRKFIKDGEITYNIDFLGELAFLMAMQAASKSDAKINLEKLSMAAYINWLEDFDGMAIENKAEEILGVYLGNTHTVSETKKNNEEQNEK